MVTGVKPYVGFGALSPPFAAVTAAMLYNDGIRVAQDAGEESSKPDIDLQQG